MIYEFSVEGLVRRKKRVLVEADDEQGAWDALRYGTWHSVYNENPKKDTHQDDEPDATYAVGDTPRDITETLEPPRLIRSYEK